MPSLTYECHIANFGWLPATGEGMIGGTTGKNLQLEAFKVHYSGPGVITIKVYVDGIGWTAPVRPENVAGTTGLAKALKAFKIELKDAPYLHVEYCAHLSNVGWQDWVMDGQEAGCASGPNHIEAIRIRLARRDPEQW